MEKQKKYRCNLLNRLTLEQQTLFFYAESDRDAQNRLIVFLQLLIGMSISDIEKIAVGFDPDNANMVNAAIQTDDKPIPVYIGVVIHESEYQGESESTKETESLLDTLKGIDANVPTV